MMLEAGLITFTAFRSTVGGLKVKFYVKSALTEMYRFLPLGFAFIFLLLFLSFTVLEGVWVCILHEKFHNSCTATSVL